MKSLEKNQHKIFLSHAHKSVGSTHFFHILHKATYSLWQLGTDFVLFVGTKHRRWRRWLWSHWLTSEFFWRRFLHFFIFYVWWSFMFLCTTSTIFSSLHTQHNCLNSQLTILLNIILSIIQTGHITLANQQ